MHGLRGSLQAGLNAGSDRRAMQRRPGWPSQQTQRFV